LPSNSDSLALAIVAVIALVALVALMIYAMGQNNTGVIVKKMDDGWAILPAPKGSGYTLIK